MIWRNVNYVLGFVWMLNFPYSLWLAVVPIRLIQLIRESKRMFLLVIYQGDLFSVRKQMDWKDWICCMLAGVILHVESRNVIIGRGQFSCRRPRIRILSLILNLKRIGKRSNFIHCHVFVFCKWLRIMNNFLINFNNI